jgi:hypothetical protein
MNIADELQKLQQLHASGALNDEEFAKAKQAVLNGTPPARASGSEGDGLVVGLFGGKKETLGDAANRYVSFGFKRCEALSSGLFNLVKRRFSIRRLFRSPSGITTIRPISPPR